MSTENLKDYKNISPVDLMYLEKYFRDKRNINEKLNDKNYWDEKYKEFLEENAF